MEHKSRSRGLAPFASVEDLSDDQDSPVEDKNRLTLPGIREDTGSRSPKPVSATPRIDISRASSSSHHDDSSPERDLFAGGTEGTGAKLGLGFTEEMAMELRSSTEELDFQDPAENETKARRKKLQQQHAVTKYELEAQSEKDIKERKDSACSDVGLLSISGRTSRLSSIGSAASAGSAASHMSGVSHISTTSHLSAVSQLSKASRCSSPHRMLLETSFCGPKPIPTVSLEAEYPPKESVEAALLARKTDPTGAVLPSEEIKITINGNNSGSSSKTANSVVTATKQSSNSSHSAGSLVKSVSSKPKSKPCNDHLSKPHSSKNDSTSTNQTKHITKVILENEFQKVISLHSDESEIEALPEVIKRPLSPENGIYIPLKGPDVNYSKKSLTEKLKAADTDYVKPHVLENVRTKVDCVRPKHSAYQEDSDLVKFISLHGDDSNEESGAQGNKESDKYDRPNEQHNPCFSPWSDVNSLHQDYFRPDELRDTGYVRKHSAGSCRSPDFEAPKVKPATLDLTQVVRPSRPVQSLTQLARDNSRTPSPAASISRGSLFRRSSESSSSSKSRASGSSDKSKKDSKNKSVFSSLFKKDQKKDKVSGKDRSGRRKSESSEKSFTMDPKFTKVEFTFNQEERILDCASIVIPLHSPDSIVEPLILGADMQSENEGVADVHLETSVTAIQLSKTEITEKEFVSEVAMLTAEVVAAIEEIKDQPALSRMNDIKNTDKTCNEAVNENQEVQRPVGIITHSKSEISINTNTETGISSKSEQFTNSKSQLAIDSKADISLKKSIHDLEVTTESQESIKKSDSEAKAGSEDRRSSESEPDSDAMPIANGQNDEDDHERKGLVHQPDSLEDELPYVPTTLPQERSVAHPIIPIKQRVSEVKTCPIDRPRSTTPINPSTLDDYVASPHEEISTHPKEKMQIVLPRSESIKENRSRSPARAKPWTHFAEQGLQSPRELRRIASPSPPTAGPPPLPPRSTTAWVSFDELPERRRTPKRITTLPQSSSQQPANIVYNYVNPEECSCECHEIQTRVNGSQCIDSTTEKCASSEYSKETIHDKEQRVYRT